MGTYVNPGNQAFQRIAGPDYVDKTGLISLVNQRIGRDSSLVCISRPRRFGKSYAAKMLTAYYDCTCDSHELFGDKSIAKANDYEKYINKYNVICLDITGFISEVKRKQESLRLVPNRIADAIQGELGVFEVGESLNTSLIRFVSETGKQIVFIIDEWDAMIREAKDDEAA